MGLKVKVGMPVSKSVAVLLFEPQHCSTAQLQHMMKLASSP
jgi:hypothetical protein